MKAETFKGFSKVIITLCSLFFLCIALSSCGKSNSSEINARISPSKPVVQNYSFDFYPTGATEPITISKNWLEANLELTNDHPKNDYTIYTVLFTITATVDGVSKHESRGINYSSGLSLKKETSITITLDKEVFNSLPEETTKYKIEVEIFGDDANGNRLPKTKFNFNTSS